MPTSKESKKLDSDRRLSELWLQEALELSLYERFCSGKMGEHAERALILHAKRHGSFADFALLDANRKLILVELKRGRLSAGDVERTLKQVGKYVEEYPKHTLGEISTWYCQHGVDVNVWFEYRGDDCLPDGLDAKSRYGRLIRWSKTNPNYYLEGTKDPGRAFEILCNDYARIVEKTLDGLGVNDRLEVSRCIMIAEEWPDSAPPDSVDDVSFELWKYVAPEKWAEPKPVQ
ncbi:hypothetical protein ACNOYE_31365 [Nannocystaceae bacterium ST9]